MVGGLCVCVFFIYVGYESCVGVHISEVWVQNVRSFLYKGVVVNQPTTKMLSLCKGCLYIYSLPSAEPAKNKRRTLNEKSK